ncbi:hypothetical protein BC628DRAFT_817750 [Trametes gibbosa]|nr:hypothetical protein BC628DRAFT_817750 [Trametes gibbosa]
MDAPSPRSTTRRLAVRGIRLMSDCVPSGRGACPAPCRFPRIDVAAHPVGGAADGRPGPYELDSRLAYHIRRAKGLVGVGALHFWDMPHRGVDPSGSRLRALRLLDCVCSSLSPGLALLVTSMRTLIPLSLMTPLLFFLHPLTVTNHACLYFYR